MALDKASLKTAIKNIFTSAIDNDNAEEYIATELSNAIDTFVKSGQVNSGIAVQVSPSTGTGATTATGTIS